MSSNVVLSGFLPSQQFTGNPLDRHSDLLKRFLVSFNPDSEVSLIVVSGRDVVVRCGEAPQGYPWTLRLLLQLLDLLLLALLSAP
jgi:hypothetical protein